MFKKKSPENMMPAPQGKRHGKKFLLIIMIIIIGLGGFGWYANNNRTQIAFWAFYVSSLLPEKVRQLIPFASLQANELSRGGANNLSSLIISDYAMATHDFPTAINNLETVLRNTKNEDNNRTNILANIFLLELKEGDFSAVIKHKNEIVKKNLSLGNSKFNNLVNLVTTIETIKNKSWQKNILSIEPLDGLNEASVGIITAWGEASRGNKEKAIEMMNNLKVEHPEIGELTTQVSLMKLLYNIPITATDFLSPEQQARAKEQEIQSNFSIPQTRLYLQSLSRQQKWDELAQFFSGLKDPIPLLLLADKEQARNRLPLVEIINTPADGLSYFLLDISVSILPQDIEDALLFNQLALFSNPKNADAIFALANIYRLLGLYDKSLATLEKLQSNKTYEPLIELSKVNIMRLTDQEDEAKKHLENLVKQRPNIVNYQLELASIAMQEYEYRQAEKIYQNIIANFSNGPEMWIYHYQLGIAQERQNKWNRAEKNFLTALQLNPNSPEVLNYLGYSWVDQRKNVNQALAMLKKANELSPSSGAILDSVGWAYYQLGEYQTARTYLEQAGQLIANDPEINDHLGDLYWQLERPTAAKLFWKKALKHYADADVKKNMSDQDKKRQKDLKKKINSGL